MRIALIGKDKFLKLALPEIPIGSYWINDNTGETEKKLVNIEGKNGRWQITTNRLIKIINPNAISITNDSVKIKSQGNIILDKAVLEEYGTYAIAIGDLSNIYFVYCYPLVENNFMHLAIDSKIKEIFIGKGEKNYLIYKNNLVSNTHTRLVLYNQNWILENIDKKFGTVVNGELVFNKSKVLHNGDIIFIMGLKIIIMKNSIFINTPLNKVEFNESVFKELKCNPINIVSDENEPLNEDYYDDKPLYSDNEYFSRAPRLTKIIKKENIKIDPPPSIDENENTPAVLVLGSTISMGLLMLLSSGRALVGTMNGSASKTEVIVEILIAFIMLVAIVLFPILNVKYEKKKKIKHEEKRQKRYRKYIDSKIEQIDEAMMKQRDILLENFIPPEECKKIILNKETRLWERNIEDHDFLTVRLGIGKVPLEADINYPEESFKMEDDNLIDILHDVTKKSKILQGAPIVYSMAEKNISALISQNGESLMNMVKSILMQLITFHSYEDLKLVFWVSDRKKWEFVKMLPHIWNDNREIRFFSDEYSDIERISKYLEEDWKNRTNIENPYDQTDFKAYTPYYLIITDDYKKIEDIRIVKEILDHKKNMGFSLLFVTKDWVQLPNECKTFITFNENSGQIFESKLEEGNQKEFNIHLPDEFLFDEISEKLSNIPIKYSISAKNSLPQVYPFLEMFDVGTIEQLNIEQRWRNNDSTMSLKTPIGIDSTGRPIILDIHEKYHGPHGLIAGATGSGKSEFIITYILSLAVNYHPDDVAFVLIDYKGGGLAGAFQKKNIKLPHLVGTITNIDKIGLQRSLDSIQSELRRRQIEFNEARNMTDEGTIDIYKYQKLYHEGVVKEPIPHLFIICDEFAELKQQQEEFMDELISVSRIGRSLGVHLILATQKPAGIVNEQIRSNSRFGVCLKVQTQEDSRDVINKPDAAFLKNQGQFFLQVGNDEYFTLGQSAWTGAQYIPSEMVRKKVDNSIEFISDTGEVIKQLDDNIHKQVKHDGEQLTRIVQYLAQIAEKEKIHKNNLWLDSIPENILVKDLRKKYHFKNNLNIVIGEYDDPTNQKQDLVELSLLNGENVVIYGGADSGKETLLSTIVYELISNYESDRVWTYLLDFGSESLKVFKDAPHVGDVIFLNESEKIGRFFEMISKEIKDRKTVLSNYNGDYNLYNETSGKIMPAIVIIMNNYEAFNEMYELDYDDTLLTLTREGNNCGISFVFTVSSYSDMRYRLTQNFKQKIALRVNNEDDYYNIFENVGKKRPSDLFGRGLISKNGEIYEFQTAKSCEPEEFNVFIKNLIEELNKSNTLKAKHVPVLPDRITVEDVKKQIKSLKKIPLGIYKDSLNWCEYNFEKSFITMITSRNIKDAGNYANSIIEELRELKNISITVLDTERILSDKKQDITGDFYNFVLGFENENSNAYNICIIIGIDKFLQLITEESINFEEKLSEADEKGKYSFIIIDSASKIKDHGYDSWYKQYVENDNGIWVGNGFDDQYVISLIDRRGINNSIGNSFGYFVKSGEFKPIKLIGMKDAGEDYG